MPDSLLGASVARKQATNATSKHPSTSAATFEVEQRWRHGLMKMYAMFPAGESQQCSGGKARSVQGLIPRSKKNIERRTSIILDGIGDGKDCDALGLQNESEPDKTVDF